MTVDPELLWVGKRIVQVNCVLPQFLGKEFLGIIVKRTLFFWKFYGGKEMGRRAAARTGDGQDGQGKAAGKNSFF